MTQTDMRQLVRKYQIAILFQIRLCHHDMAKVAEWRGEIIDNSECHVIFEILHPTALNHSPHREHTHRQAHQHKHHAQQEQTNSRAL